MKIIETRIFKGRNIYSHKKCIRMDLDLEKYSDIPSKYIEDFNFNLINMIPELNSHKCSLGVDRGFVKRLEEGTYLAHICEHMIIALQNKIGIDVSYGKAREVEGEHYYVIFQYEYEKVALESANLAIDIINALIKKTPINYEERINFIKTILLEETIGPSTKAICDYAKGVGLPIMKLGDSDFYQIGYGKQGRIIEGSIGANTKCVSVDISCNKLLTKEILELQNIPVAKGFRVNNIIDILKKAEEIGYPVVLKPQYGNKGKGVALNIKNEKELLTRYKVLKEEFSDLLIEKYCEGYDFRVCVVGNEVVAVSLRTPPTIKGDGKSTVLELIEELNKDVNRGEDHEKPLTKIKIDDEVIKCIEESRESLNSILDVDKKIVLRKNANISTGGEAIDVTDVICKENIDICIRIAKALDLDICGIDICTKDISKPLNKNGIIIEVNSSPGLRMHLNPTKGKSRDIGKAIVNMIYEGNVENIPVMSITGTNGKTTTTRVISHTLSKMGYTVGMTSTDGIYINDNCIDCGDDTGFNSARAVLLNKDVEVAVLETARGGIIKRGLGYDLADVAVITNIREDHLGIDGVNDIEDLCYVKSLVAEAVKKDGYVVLNADDIWSRNILSRVKSNVILFSKDNNNSMFDYNNNKNIYVTLEDDEIVVINNSKKYKICSINEVPITLNGNLKFNVENILATCAALVGMNVDYCMIKNGITTYRLDSKKNSGRFNCYDVNGINVILDYGHNIDGYKAVLESLKSMKSNGSLLGVIGIPGDRSDNMAIEIGKLSTDYLDYIVIKEDINLRGRKQGEIAKLIENGILNSEIKNNYEIILNEQEALIKALNKANRGDTIVVFFEDIEPLEKIIEEYSNDNYKSNILNIASAK